MQTKIFKTLTDNWLWARRFVLWVLIFVTFVFAFSPEWILNFINTDAFGFHAPIRFVISIIMVLICIDYWGNGI